MNPVSEPALPQMNLQQQDVPALEDLSLPAALVIELQWAQAEQFPAPRFIP